MAINFIMAMCNNFRVGRGEFDGTRRFQQVVRRVSGSMKMDKACLSSVWHCTPTPSPIIAPAPGGQIERCATEACLANTCVRQHARGHDTVGVQGDSRGAGRTGRYVEGSLVMDSFSSATHGKGTQLDLGTYVLPQVGNCYSGLRDALEEPR